MCLKPQPPRQMPEETGRIGAYLLDAASPYHFIGAVLYAQFHDEDLADRYSNAPAEAPLLRDQLPIPRTWV